MRLKHIGIAAGIAAASLSPCGAYAQPGRDEASCQAAKVARVDAREDARADAGGARTGCGASFDPFTDGARAGRFDPFTDGVHASQPVTAQTQRKA